MNAPTLFDRFLDGPVLPVLWFAIILSSANALGWLICNAVAMAWRSI